jgi:hypothetical protein
MTSETSSMTQLEVRLRELESEVASLIEFIGQL